MLCYWYISLQSIRLCPFWARHPFVPMGMHYIASYEVSFRVPFWMFTILLLSYFFLPFSSSAVSASEAFFISAVWSPMWFLLPDMVIASDGMPHHWAFYFQGSEIAISCSGIWSGSMCKVHITLQELQAVAFMLHKMVIWHSSKVLALHLANKTATAYFCNQSGTAFLFLYRLAWHILNVGSKCGITLIPAYIPTHLSVEADCLSWWRLIPEQYLLAHITQATFHLLSQLEVDWLASSYASQCQLCYNLELPLPLGVLGLNAFNHPYTYQVSYVFPPPALVPLVLSKFLVKHVTGQFRLLILVVPCWMEAPWLPKVLSILEDILHECSIVKASQWMFL